MVEGIMSVLAGAALATIVIYVRQKVRDDRRARNGEGTPDMVFTLMLGGGDSYFRECPRCGDFWAPVGDGMDTMQMCPPCFRAVLREERAPDDTSGLG